MKGLKQGILSSIFLITAFSFSSCIYDPPDRITEISSDFTPPDYVISQTIDFDKDTLYAWNKTNFNFSFASSDQAIYAVIFDFLGKTLSFENASGSFVVDPAGFQSGSYTLTCKVFVHSGTGSLADHLGAEGFVYKKDFVLILEGPGNANTGFTHVTIENGFLKIHWRKFDRPYFDSYTINVSDSALSHYFSRTIHDVNVTSLTDSSYVGGTVKFNLLVNCRDENGYPVNLGSHWFTYRFPIKMSFKEEGDSLTLNWTEIPFNHTIYINHEEIGRPRSYKTKNPGLGYPVRYQISVAPVAKLTYEFQRYNIYGDFLSGIKSDVTFTRMAYSPELNIFFTKDPMHVRSYDGNSLALLGHYDYSWDYYDQNSLALSPDRTLLFSTENGKLLQLNSNTLDLMKSDPIAPYASGTKKALLIHLLNERLMLLSFNSWLTIYDYVDQTIIDQEALEISQVEPYHLTVSADGSYAANCGNGKLKVFRNNNNSQLDLISETTGSFLECIFDPHNPGNLLLVTETENYFVSLPGMERIHTVPDTVKGFPVNFDPVSGYILFVSNRYNILTVYDYINGQVKFTAPHHGYYDEFYLGKNRIFHSGGYNIKID